MAQAEPRSSTMCAGFSPMKPQRSRPAHGARHPAGTERRATRANPRGGPLLSASDRGRVLRCVAQLNSDPERILEGASTSPGELRKLMIACELLNTPALMIMDEPTNHLDLRFRRGGWSRARAIRGRAAARKPRSRFLSACTNVMREVKNECSIQDEGALHIERLFVYNKNKCSCMLLQKFIIYGNFECDSMEVIYHEDDKGRQPARSSSMSSIIR